MLWELGISFPTGVIGMEDREGADVEADGICEEGDRCLGGGITVSKRVELRNAFSRTVGTKDSLSLLLGPCWNICVEVCGGRDQFFGDRDGLLACPSSTGGGTPFDVVSKGDCVEMSGGRDQFFGESGVLVVC